MTHTTPAPWPLTADGKCSGCGHNHTRDRWPSCLCRCRTTAEVSPMIDTTPTITDTFTFTCPWGCTIGVRRGAEEPHSCLGTVRVAELLSDAYAPEPIPEGVAEHIARGLDRTLRERFVELFPEAALTIVARTTSRN